MDMEVARKIIIGAEIIIIRSMNYWRIDSAPTSPVKNSTKFTTHMIIK